MNLAVNARDAMPDGGKLITEDRQCTIWTSLRPHSPARRPRAATCMLAVSDTGTA